MVLVVFSYRSKRFRAGSEPMMRGNRDVSAAFDRLG
jgi:hypothetical protein